MDDPADDPVIGRRAQRPFSPLAGFADKSAGWLVPGSLAGFGVLVFVTWIAVQSPVLLGSAVCLIGAAPLAYLALRERPGTLWFGLGALVATVAGIVLLARL